MKKLHKPPLFLVIAQVKFSPILALGKYINDIQERFRDHGYPLFEEEQLREFDFGGTPGAPPDLRVRRRWIFLTLDKSRSVILTDDFVAMDTADYDTFPTFLQNFRNAVRCITESVRLEALTRIGLRYVNEIVCAGDSREMFKPELRGILPRDLNSEDIRSSILSNIQFAHRRLILRIVHSQESRAIPPDLASTKLEFSKRPIKRAETSSILDLDCFSEEREKYHEEKLSNELTALHDRIEEVFEAALTPEAVQTME